MCLVRGVKIDPGLFKDRFFLVSYPKYFLIEEKSIVAFY